MQTLLKVAATVLAMGLAGESLVDDGEGTSLPISPTANLPVLKGAPGEAYGFTDAGLLWTPTPLEQTLQELDAGARRAVPDGGAIPPGCASIAARIAHRRAFIDAVEQAANTHGPERGLLIYCQQHPEERECDRPATAVERDLDELIQNDPSEPAPEADGWIARWGHELAACRLREAARRSPQRHP